MRVVAMVGMYVPRHEAGGAEVMLHALLCALAEAGHDVRVVLAPKHLPPAAQEPDNEQDHELDGEQDYELDGVPVLVRRRTELAGVAESLRPDALIGQLSMLAEVSALAKQLSVPYVHVVHNTYTESQRDLGLGPDLVVFNSRWVQRHFAHRNDSSIVVHPPVYAERHATSPGDRITIVNLKRAKGACVFWSLAERHPERSFLAVVGGYGRQMMRSDLANVEVQPFTSDMRADVWARTRLLVAPSSYESYGLVALEACCSGIPVIAHPTAGLKESLCDAAIFADRDDIEAWAESLVLLDDPKTYATYSGRALTRIAEVERERDQELQGWVDAMKSLWRR